MQATQIVPQTVKLRSSQFTHDRQQAASDLKPRVDFQRFVEDHEGPGKGHGKAIMYRWRDERKPSTAVYKGGYKDYGSDESGDVFTYCQRPDKLNLPFPEAVAYVSAWLGDYTPSRPLIHRPAQQVTQHTEPPDANWQQAAASAVTLAIEYLGSDQPGALATLNWLKEDRHLTDDTIRHFQIGYLPSWTKTPWCKDNGKFASVAPGVIIPMYQDGTLTAVKTRRRVGTLAKALGMKPDTNRDGDEVDKYLYLSGSHVGPFLAGDFQVAQKTVLVESALDAILIWQETGDLVNVLATNGASNGIDQYTERLRTGPGCIAIMDNDPNGAGEKWGARLQANLPHVLLVKMPAGKDTTEYAVDHGGDVRAWITDLLPSVQNQVADDTNGDTPLSDGLRWVALNCKLDAALIVYELAVTAGLEPGNHDTSELYTANERLALGIDDKMIRRGRDQGADYFWTNSGQESQQDQNLESQTLSGDSNPEFVQKSARCQKTAHRPYERFTLQPVSEIKTALRRALPYRLLERMYPALARLIPDPRLLADLVATLDDLTADEQSALIDRLTAAAALQDEVETKRRYKKYLNALQEMSRRLDDPNSTPLPAGWVNGRQYRAILYNARLKAGKVSADLAYDDLALEMGVNPSNVKAVLDRANIKNNKPPAEITVLPERANVVAQACRAAKGKGKVTGFVPVRNGRPDYSDRRALEHDDLQKWADDLPTDVQVAVLVQGRAHQEIAGNVKPLPSKEVREAARLARRLAQDIQHILTQSDNSVLAEQPNEPVTRNASPKPPRKRPLFTGSAPDPMWLRDLLILAYERLNGATVNLEVRDRLSIRDAVDLLLLPVDRPVTPWVERSDPDRVADISEVQPPDDPYEIWLRLPDKFAQDAYFDTLTVEQRGNLKDRYHYGRQKARSA